MKTAEDVAKESIALYLYGEQKPETLVSDIVNAIAQLITAFAEEQVREAYETNNLGPVLAKENYGYTRGSVLSRLFKRHSSRNTRKSRSLLFIYRLRISGMPAFSDCRAD